MDLERSLRKTGAALFISTETAALLNPLYFKLRISCNWKFQHNQGRQKLRRGSWDQKISFRHLGSVAVPVKHLQI